MDHEARRYIDQVAQRLDELRATDQEAIRVAREDISRVMLGFPQEYAKKDELDIIRSTAIRLDRIALPKDEYYEAHKRLVDESAKKLDRNVFEATLSEWSVWRRTIEAAMAESRGGQITMARLAGLITFAIAVISFVVLFANHNLR